MILRFIYKIICKTIYYAVLCIMAIPVILYTIISETAIAVTKHPDRFDLPWSGSLTCDLDRIHFVTSSMWSSKLWGPGSMSGLCDYIRRKRGEIPAIGDVDSEYMKNIRTESFRKDQIKLAKVLKDEYGIGDGGIYRLNKEKDVNKDAKTVSGEDKDLH